MLSCLGLSLSPLCLPTLKMGVIICNLESHRNPRMEKPMDLDPRPR